MKEILIIEDSPILGPLLVTVMQKKFHRRSTVVTSIAECDKVRRSVNFQKVGLVISDRDIVGGNAWQWVATNIPDDLPVIFMSGAPPVDVLPTVFYYKGDPVSMLIDMVSKALTPPT